MVLAYNSYYCVVCLMVTSVSTIPSLSLIKRNYNSIRKNCPSSPIYLSVCAYRCFTSYILDVATGPPLPWLLCTWDIYPIIFYYFFAFSYHRVLQAHLLFFLPWFRNQPFLQGALLPFIVEMVFRKTKTLTLDGLIATGVSLFLGPFSRQV